jgi:hypothetical protein
VKQYCYFRNPANGRPHTGNDGKHSPVAILREMGENSEHNAGGITWRNIPSEKFDVTLAASFVVIDPDDRELNEHDARQILWKAISTVLGKTPRRLDPVALLREADPLAAAYFRQAPTEYALLSTLSLADLPFPTISIGSSRIVPLKSRPKSFPYPEVLLKGWHHAAFEAHLNGTKYRHVKIATKGRSMYEASDTALNALNMLRSVWSVFDTWGRWTFFSGSPEKRPLATIHTGPIHTIHHANGTPANENLYWYTSTSPDYPLYDDAKRWAGLEKNRKFILRKIKTLKYRRELESILLRYIDCLDQLDPNVAFLQMWGILERVTNTIGAKYEDTIDRAIWVYAPDERQIAKEMLQGLRFRRNQYVHAGSAATNSDQTAYLMKSFLDPHMFRLMTNRLEVSSMEEYAEILSLPTELAKLEKRYDLSRRGLKLQKLMHKEASE